MLLPNNLLSKTADGLTRSISFCVLVLFLHAQLSAQDFPLGDKSKPLVILYGSQAPKLDSIAAHLLAGDIERVTGRHPQVITCITGASGNVIVIGNIHSNLTQSFIHEKRSFNISLKNKWESFGLKVVDKPMRSIERALVIAGSDTRGTAYGVFTISGKIGVSPWSWWADVPVTRRSGIVIHQPDSVSSTPSVKFRGIFINDEDWGLRPWAANTFEPKVKNIGPKTYAKVFELLLRLKANLIWPAMHPGTVAFYSVPGNKEMAAAYSIVIGSSHAEPMLRNNVSEWNEKTMGPFNYITNREKIYQYWEQRVKESSGNDVIYSMGMRGVHDSQMEGVRSAKEAVPLLETIIKDQRGLLEKYNDKDVTQVPQVFTPYKEVLEFYDNGLKLPGDITLVWPDDNYGYIQRLDNDEERKRSGGAGVYYHASYWGRPHDYLWLSSTHPSLIREEMTKAYETGANRLWVLNVGDIKPLEYNIQLFLDMAYNIKPFGESLFAKKHLLRWNDEIFGKQAPTITDVMWKYYDLAFERRPEFMGWSQTEPTTLTNYTSYNHFYYGDEAQRRVDAYDSLETIVNQLRDKMDTASAAAFYQLVYYPVIGAAEMNKKFLYRDKAYLYGEQNRISVYDYAAMSREAYQRIEEATAYYNDTLQNGKWKGMMSMAPRELPVYGPPVLPAISIAKEKVWGVSPEGSTSSGQKLLLPVFTKGLKQKYFIDLYLSDSVKVSWSTSTSQKWIYVSQERGMLSPQRGENQVRLWISVDWGNVPQTNEMDGTIEIVGAGKTYVVNVKAVQPKNTDKRTAEDFVESNGYVSIFAQHHTAMNNTSAPRWQLVNGLGHTGASMMTAVLPTVAVSADTAIIRKHASFLGYEFVTSHETEAKAVIFALPTLPLNRNYSMRCGVSIDGGAVQVLDFAANSVGRTEEWKQNVLSNTALRKTTAVLLRPGRHELTVYSIDPGLILDRIVIDLGGMKTAYGVIPETR